MKIHVFQSTSAERYKKYQYFFLYFKTSNYQFDYVKKEMTGTGISFYMLLFFVLATRESDVSLNSN